MLHTIGKGRMIEEFLFLYLIGHEGVKAAEVCFKFNELKGIRLNVCTVNNVIRNLKMWGFIKKEPNKGYYYLTDKGSKYYADDFNEGNFIYFNPDKDNVNI